MCSRIRGVNLSRFIVSCSRVGVSTVALPFTIIFEPRFETKDKTRQVYGFTTDKTLLL